MVDSDPSSDIAGYQVQEFHEGDDSLITGSSEVPTSEAHTVWIVEDDERFSNQLARLINLSGAFVCERVYPSCEPAIKDLLKDIPPDIVLMDIGLPGISGIEGVRRLKAITPSIQVVILTVFEDAESIVGAIGAGAVGYLHKASSLDVIVESLRLILSGGAPINPQIARKMLDLFSHSSSPGGDYGLTRREKEVLGLLVEGLVKKQIADKLFVSPNTIDKHIRSIYAKLEVQTRSGAVAKALKEHLL